MAVFDRYRYVLDAELQQRACEYYVIANQESDDLLQVICDEIPPFPERESALIGRLIKKQGQSIDKRTWSVGSPEMRKKGSTGAEAVAAKATNGAASTTDQTLNSLAGLDLSKQSTETDLLSTRDLVESPTEILNGPPKQLASPQTTEQKPKESPMPAPKQPIQYTHGAEPALKRLAYMSDGVLFEDAQIQIGLRSEYHGHLGRVCLYFGNRLSTTFSAFTVTVEVPEPEALQVSLPQIPASTLSGNQQVSQILQIECKDYFKEFPILRVSYLAGSHQTLTLRLPVFVTKFIEKASLTSPDFFDRWKQIGGLPLEAQTIFPIKLDSSGAIDTTRNKRIVAGFSLAVLEGIDPNPSNVVGAGVFHMSVGGKVGCLVRLEPNADAKVCVVWL